MKYIKTLENHINEPKVGDFVVAKQKGMGPFVKTMDTRIGKIIGKTERFFPMMIQRMKMDLKYHMIKI